MARKPLREIVVRLAQELVEGQFEIDAARVAGHAGIVAAEGLPEREVGALRLEVPQGHVEGRERQDGRAAAAAVMEGPPGLVPEALDLVGLLAVHDLGQFAGEDRVDGGAVAADGEGVADALRPVGVADAHGVELEGAHLAMHGVGQNGRQRDAVEAGFDGSDPGHGRPSFASVSDAVPALRPPLRCACSGAPGWRRRAAGTRRG